MHISSEYYHYRMRSEGSGTFLPSLRTEQQPMTCAESHFIVIFSKSRFRVNS